MNNDIRELNTAELDIVAGGLDCKAAAMVAAINENTAKILTQMGNSLGAAYFFGAAHGNMQGCTGGPGEPF
jgi:hypothetical protein